MSHIDIINLYQDYKKLGKSDDEAMLLIKSMDVNTMDFVTKTELAYELGEVRAEIRADFGELKSEMRAGFSELRADIKWLWRVLVGFGIVSITPIIQSWLMPIIKGLGK